MPKFCKKPVVIEAVQWTGANVETICDFISEKDCCFEGGELIILTLEDGKDRKAKHVADPGDWIIKGIKGEFYPCKPDIFVATYDAEGEVITGDGSGTALPPVSQAVRQAG